MPLGWNIIDAQDACMQASRLIFKPACFAPGVWAGTEGATVVYNGAKYTILQVDMEKRELLLSPEGL